MKIKVEVTIHIFVESKQDKNDTTKIIIYALNDWQKRVFGKIAASIVVKQRGELVTANIIPHEIPTIEYENKS